MKKTTVAILGDLESLYYYYYYITFWWGWSDKSAAESLAFCFQLCHLLSLGSYTNCVLISPFVSGMDNNYVTGLGNWIISYFVKRSHDFIGTTHGTRCLICVHLFLQGALTVLGKNEDIMVQKTVTAALYCVTNYSLILNLFTCFQNMSLADEYCQVSVFQTTLCKAGER